jgi:hypothetical protein
MISIPKAAPAPKAPEPQRPAEVVVRVDNTEVASAVQRQNEQLVQLNTAISALAAKIEKDDVITVSVTEWTDTGRIKTVRITKG